MRLSDEVFTSILQRVRCFTIAHANGEALRYLGEAATAGARFVFLKKKTLEDITGFQTAVRSSYLMKTLKLLLLEICNFYEDGDEETANPWRLLESVLNVQDHTSGLLSRLETLVLIGFMPVGECFVSICYLEKGYRA